MRFTRETAAAAGARGGASRSKKLTVERVKEELGELSTHEDAERWLEQIALWTAGGLLKGAAAGACNRSVEVWLRVRESKTTRDLVDKLQKRIRELEGQGKSRSVGIVR